MTMVIYINNPLTNRFLQGSGNPSRVINNAIQIFKNSSSEKIRYNQDTNSASRYTQKGKVSSRYKISLGKENKVFIENLEPQKRPAFIKMALMTALDYPSDWLEEEFGIKKRVLPEQEKHKTNDEETEPTYTEEEPINFGDDVFLESMGVNETSEAFVTKTEESYDGFDEDDMLEEDEEAFRRHIIRQYNS